MAIKISTYAKNHGLCYRTVYNHFKQGLLKGIVLPTGTILIEENSAPVDEKVVVYCRESTSENKASLENQVKRCLDFCNAKGWRVYKVVKEIGSGLNDKRQKFLDILTDFSITKIVVEHSDRFARFGLEPIKKLLELQKRELFIINESQSDQEDLIQDFISLITSFCVRIYGQRRTKKATEKLIKELI